MSLKTWPSNITVLSRFARISCTETSTRSKRELYALSTVVKTLYKGPIASSNFGCCLTKFEPAATTKLPALFSNIRSLINSSIFLVGWRLSGTGFSNKIINIRKFARDERELLEKWIMYQNAKNQIDIDFVKELISRATWGLLMVLIGNKWTVWERVSNIFPRGYYWQYTNFLIMRYRELVPFILGLNLIEVSRALEEGYLVVTFLFRPSFDEKYLSQVWFFFGSVFLIHEFISSFNFSSFSVTATIPLNSSLYRKSLHPETMFHVRPSSQVQRIWKFLQKRLLFPEYFCSYRYVLNNKAT